jgi:hypothetical protein
MIKTEHGVVIKLIATDVGLKFTLSAEGVLLRDVQGGNPGRTRPLQSLCTSIE